MWEIFCEGKYRSSLVSDPWPPAFARQGIGVDIERSWYSANGFGWGRYVRKWRGDAGPGVDHGRRQRPLDRLGIAKMAADHGAELAFTYRDALRKRVEPMAASVGSDLVALRRDR